MRKSLFITGVFLFLLPSFSFSQGEKNNWYFGFHAGVTFTTGAPVVLNNCAPSFADKWKPVTVSDSAGNLLFYAGEYYQSPNLNGTVYNRNHQIMPNGHNLYTAWETQQNYLAFKKLDDSNQYYLFTMDEEWSPPGYPWPYPHGLTYSIVDMNLDGGLGDIPSGQKSVMVPGALMTASVLSGTRHHNNKDVWITVREYYNSNLFLTYLITSAGINPVPVISQSLFTLQYTGIVGPITIRFSPDGTKMIALYQNKFEYCLFNSITGNISPLFSFNLSSGNNNTDAEFSVNSSLLYVSDLGNVNTFKIYQFDATKTDSLQFALSKIEIGDQTSNIGSEPTFQRGPDNKI